MTQTETLQKQQQFRTQHLLPSFIYWYFVERPYEIVSHYIDYAKAFSESFSLMFMLKTLFSPWKSITDEYPSKGFNLEEILSTFFLNITSRVIGFVFRLCAMIAGVVIQAGLLIGFTSYLALWLLFPVILIAAVPVLLQLS